ncbi:phospholipid-metabolizing enzyme A-C1-like [Dendronephthya gigantea]|uniref:phospholipid-metabolizing enzyme A-C1-like n=1 Tax=Dendronephthya gigantea TaxID=151771 RepID=UPI00106B5B8F|nr:phospholipid-metabolizing enzyme A-C1-like [Dendronephthya gigantea]
MGGSSSKKECTSRSQALVLYDNDKARKAVQHIRSDFVDARSLVDNLLPGDMIQVKGNFIHQWFYSHFAIFIGNGEIVHVDTPRSGSWSRKCDVVRVKMTDAFCGKLVRKNNHLDNTDGFRDRVLPRSQIVKTARDWVGKYWDYNFYTNNCEHFVTLCRYGRPISLQSSGIGDLISGKINFGEFVDHSVYSIKEKASTLSSWIKRKARGLWDGIERTLSFPALEG